MTRRSTPPTPATEPPGNPDDLATLARRVERLTISRTNPAAFFEERSEIAYELRRMATTRGCAGAKRDRDSAETSRIAGHRKWLKDQGYQTLMVLPGTMTTPGGTLHPGISRFAIVKYYYTLQIEVE